MKQFKKVILLFGEFKFFLSKMTYLDEKIRKKSKLSNS